MPYSDFIEREDVYNILADTLEYYFECSVNINEKGTLIHNGEKDMYLCFPKINAIIPNRFNCELEQYIRRDNRITDGIVKRIAMMMYLYCVFKYPRAFMDRSINIQPIPIGYKDILIYPGNKKIKIMHFDNKVIDNILKSGFKNEWFRRELEIRENPKWDFILPLTLIKDGVYREDMIIGYGYPRLDRKSKLSLVPYIRECIEEMQSSGEIERIGEYVIQLIAEFEIGTNSIANRIPADEIEGLRDFIKSLSSLVDNRHGTLRLVFSHGDLQGGNIILQNDTEKLWILDWETWRTRSEYYDKMLFFYNMRNSNRMPDNIKRMFNDKGKMLSLSSKAPSLLKDIVIIFLMEDILWQINETETLPEQAISNGLKHYISYVRQCELLQVLGAGN